MSDFSDALNRYISQSGLTESQLARISGFTRSYVALMRNGQRISPDSEKIEKLIRALCLSPEDYRDIWDSYQRVRYGEKNYQLQLDVIHFLESFGRLPSLSVGFDYHHTIPDVAVLKSRVDLEMFLKAVVEQESGKSGGRVRFFLQESFDYLLTLVASIERSGSSVRIEQILCLDGNEAWGEYGLERNLRAIQEILPLILAGKNYEARYYYKRIAAQDSDLTFLPNVLLTSEYVVNFSVNMECATVSRDPQVIALYRELLDARRRSCRKLLTRLPASENIFRSYQKAWRATDTIYFIAGQPCMGVLQVDSFVNKYYALEDKTLLYALLDLLKADREMFTTVRSMTGYFTEEGIRRLMEEGRIDEIPMELYRPIEPRDRRKLLKLLIQAASGSVYSLYLLDADRVSFPAGLEAVGYSMTDVYLVYAAERQDARLAIEERSIARIMYTFLENLKISAFVKTREESLQYLRDVYEEYEG